MINSRIKEIVNKYVDKNQASNAGLLYFFMTALYGLGGFISATYIVFGAIYLFHVVIILSQIFYSTEGIFSKWKEIDKVHIFILLVSVSMLSFLSGAYVVVIGFCLYIFLLFFCVLYFSKKYSQ